MKKILLAFTILTVAAGSLIGCGSNDEPEGKSEEELRAEIRAEIEAENQENQEVQESQTTNPDGSISLLPIYHMNQEYPINFYENNSEPDFFTVQASGEEITLKTGSLEFEFQNIYAELVLHQFKIVEQTDDYYNIFVLSEADPPHGPDMFRFFRYSPGYDLEYLGTVVPEVDFEEAIIEDFTYAGVNINGNFYSYRDHQDQSTSNDGDKQFDASEVILRFNTNETIHFDLNEDGNEEEILYKPGDMSENGQLIVSGFDPIEIADFPFGETDYFVIARFSDRFGTEMNMIGILDHEPNGWPITHLFAITTPRGEDFLGSVGSVGGKLVSASEYSSQSEDDFNNKAVIIPGEGIEAPVWMSVTPQTWIGRNMFTFYSTYVSLIDNIDPYGIDYITNIELVIEQSITGYLDKDNNSDEVTFLPNQNVRFVATDNEAWVKVIADDGTEGWVPVSEITEDVFSGFRRFN